MTKWIERLALVLLVFFSWWSWTVKQEADRRRVIAVENAYAAGDTVRVLRDERIADSVGFAISLQQREVELNGLIRRLAKAERLQARLHADLAVSTNGVDTVVVGVVSPDFDSIGRLVDSVAITGPPISGTIAAAFQPLVRTRWDIRLQPDPIPLTVTVGCRKGRPPLLAVTGPAWATVTPKGVLDPAICHPKARRNPLWGFLVGMGVGVVTWELAR